MRHVKRAVRADLHRYKAFIEMQELETGAWRGVIIDGEVVEPHDESYDEEREYSDVEDLRDEAEASEEEQEDEQSESEEQEEEQPVAESDEDDEDEDEDEAPAKAKSQRFARPDHGRRSRTGGSNGSGKPERVGSGGGRRTRGD
jgi:hypothetical protein